MKKQKIKPSGRTILKQVQAAKMSVPRKRPLHVHVALHPMSILALLCMGVLLVSFTLNAVADSYLVTAIVEAPPLTAPAVISAPANGTITGTQAIGVRGTCPDNSYVDLFDNGTFVGEAICSSGAFHIGVSLVTGANQLQAQDYNITNSPGPASSPVVITYVPGAPQLPSDTSSGTVVIGQLVVTQVDTNVPYQQNGTLTVDNQPTFAGVAPPLSHVTVAVSSGMPCQTTASLLGYWSCTVSGLAVGQHTVDVVADANGGTHLIFPTFKIVVSAGPATAVPVVPPLSLVSSYSYRVYNVGQTVTYSIHISGGRAPYAVMVSWGDGHSDLSIRPVAGTFSISHTYGWTSVAKDAKLVRVEAIDAAGQSATLQFDTILRNPALHNTIANITKSTGLWGLFEKLRPWLWLMWPGYLIVLLLVFSFWLGEHEELAQAQRRRRLAALRGWRRHAHAHR